MLKRLVHNYSATSKLVVIKDIKFSQSMNLGNLVLNNRIDKYSQFQAKLYTTQTDCNWMIVKQLSGNN